MATLSTLLDEISCCTKCSRLKPWRRFPKEAHGDIHSQAMLVSEAPGEDSVEKRRFWSGSSGTRLRNILRESNRELEDVFYLTDTVKCLPPNNGKPTREEIANCRHFLQRELDILDPRHVIAFGETAIRWFKRHCRCKETFRFTSLLDIQNNTGFRVVDFGAFKLFPLMHPSRANVPRERGSLHMNYEIYKQHLQEVFAII